MQATSRVHTWFTRAMVLALLLTITGTASVLVAQEAAAQTDAGTQVNVELILDSSGSMAEQTNTGESRIGAAKRVLIEVIGAIPEDRP